MTQHPEHAGFQVSNSQPLIAIPWDDHGRQGTRYFTDEAEADAALGSDVTTDALNLAGAWSDLDFDELVDALDRIRHERTPTPPIDLDR
ncbi:MAG TPA: hypothetical protein VKQ30_07665 [Ktedonobacterales bacterium]|nr:hypothetical protein [Ktedonobacterales bacterium]